MSRRLAGADGPIFEAHAEDFVRGATADLESRGIASGAPHSMRTPPAASCRASALNSSW